MPFMDETIFWQSRATFLVFAVCVVGFALTALGARVFNRTRLKNAARGFLADERGAGYSLAFTMVLPFYVFMMCFIMETTFVMTASMGVRRAAYAAARAAAVLGAVEKPSDRNENDVVSSFAKARAKRAAATALTPFSSGMDSRYNSKTKASEDGRAYARAYKDFLRRSNVKQKVRDDYIVSRYASAENRIKVELTASPFSGSDSDGARPCDHYITATVTYDAPFRLPLVGRCLGGKYKDGEVVYTMKSTTSLPNEAPRNSSGYLGLPTPWASARK